MYWFILATIALIYGIAVGDVRAIILGIILNMVGIAMHYLKSHEHVLGGMVKSLRAYGGCDGKPCDKPEHAEPASAAPDSTEAEPASTDDASVDPYGLEGAEPERAGVEGGEPLKRNEFMSEDYVALSTQETKWNPFGANRYMKYTGPCSPGLDANCNADAPWEFVRGVPQALSDYGAHQGAVGKSPDAPVSNRRDTGFSNEL